MMGVAEPDLREQVEKALEKGSWHKRLFAPFAKAVKLYGLVNDGDRIAVCISGGKDSMLMAKLMQELQKHPEAKFELEFLVMDPGYAPENRKLIEENAGRLGVPITVFETKIFNVVSGTEKSPCYLCARMRRGHLYKKARELGCNKIALGHHYDDVIETVLMSVLFSGQVQTMMPKLHSTNYEGMELIRPMYFVREDDIIRWRELFGLRFLKCACRFTESLGDPDGDMESKRLQVKELIARLKKENPNVEGNIFRSVENVALDAVLGWKTGCERHSFLDEYDKKK